MQRAMGPHACPFLFFGRGQAPPLLYTGLAGRSVKFAPMGREAQPRGRPEGPHAAPGRSRPYAWGRPNGLLVGEQAEEDFVTEQPSSVAES